MLQKGNLTIGTAVANQSGAMEAGTISKNERSLKSQMSKGNLLKMAVLYCFILCICTPVYTQDCIDKAQNALDKGGDLSEQKKYSEAISYYKTAISHLKDCLNSTSYNKELINEHIATVYSAIGSIYHNTKQHDQVIDALKQSIQYNSKDVKTYEDLGRAYVNLQQYDYAEEAFRNAIRIYPNSGIAHAQLGTIYFLQREDGNTALYFYEKALTLSFRDDDYGRLVRIQAEGMSKRLKDEGYSSSRAKIR